MVTVDMRDIEKWSYRLDHEKGDELTYLEIKELIIQHYLASLNFKTYMVINTSTSKAFIVSFNSAHSPSRSQYAESLRGHVSDFKPRERSLAKWADCVTVIANRLANMCNNYSDEFEPRDLGGWKFINVTDQGDYFGKTHVENPDFQQLFNLVTDISI